MTTINLLREIESSETSSPVEALSVIERRILKHAMRSFGRRGYAATSLRSIAAEAQVTAPMVAYYFKSKEGLFVRIAEIVMASLALEVERTLSEPRSFRGAMKAIAEAHAGLSERSPDAVEFMLALVYGPREGQPELDLDEMYRPIALNIRTTLQRGIASGEFVSRAGLEVNFLVEQFVSLIHEHSIRSFRARRTHRPNPVSLEMSLDHFFFGAGNLAKDSTS